MPEETPQRAPRKRAYTGPRNRARDDIGAQPTARNANPGAGRARVGQRPGPRKQLVAALGEPPDVDDSDTATARKRARDVFEKGMTDAKRRKMLNAMITRAESGDVAAYRVLMAYDLGLPTAPARGSRGEPLTGETIGKSLEKLLGRMQHDGVDTGLVERRVELTIWDNDVAEHAEDGPSGS